MSYTDAEMLMATQIAYLDYSGKNDGNGNVGYLVDSILNKYGTYDSSTGTYTMNEGVTGAAKAQFETAQNIWRLSEQNNVTSWRHWTVVDSRSNQDTSGYYGCLIDTGDGNAIVGCRGSESYDDQLVKDWVVADIGRLNNELTQQQSDATAYMEYLYKKYGDSYDNFSFTGHSLGGSLATHAAVTAPKGMQDKTDTVISFDGPGFSDEYLKKHADQIARMAKKIRHYEYSWVGSLLNQPDGIINRVIKAHDDRDKDHDNIFLAQLHRHATQNVEFDENGNVMDGERGALQRSAGPFSKALENSPWFLSLMFADKFLGRGIAAYFYSVADQVIQRFDQAVQAVRDKMNELYNQFLSYIVSGDYEVNASELGNMVQSLDTVQRRLNAIAGEVNDIRANLPFDSVSAFYYKNCLALTQFALASEGRHASKISKAVSNAAGKYNRGDQQVAGIFV